MSAELKALLDAMQARADAATEGPWESDDTDPSIWGPKVIVVGNYTAADGYDSPAWEDGSPDDRAFIAAARQDLPRLIAAVRAVLERIAVMEREGHHLRLHDHTRATGTALIDAAYSLRTALRAAQIGGDDE